jgi:hypothetical protein
MAKKQTLFQQHKRDSTPVVTRGTYSDMLHDIASPKAQTITGATQAPIIDIYAPRGLTGGLTK